MSTHLFGFCIILTEQLCVGWWWQRMWTWCMHLRWRSMQWVGLPHISNGVSSQLATAACWWDINEMASTWKAGHVFVMSVCHCLFGYDGGFWLFIRHYEAWTERFFVAKSFYHPSKRENVIDELLPALRRDKRITVYIFLGHLSPLKYWKRDSTYENGQTTTEAEYRIDHHVSR